MDYLAQMGLGRDQKASLLQSDSLNNESDREMQNVGGLNLNSSSGDDVEKGSLTCTTCADSKLSKETDSTQSFREERRDSNEDKACFLCLESDLRCDPLRKCCSQCSAMTHAKCWAEWRYKQRVASLRYRLAGERIVNSQLHCSICRSGIAKTKDENE